MAGTLANRIAEAILEGYEWHEGDQFGLAAIVERVLCANWAAEDDEPAPVRLTARGLPWGSLVLCGGRVGVVLSSGVRLAGESFDRKASDVTVDGVLRKGAEPGRDYRQGSAPFGAVDSQGWVYLGAGIWRGQGPRARLGLGRRTYYSHSGPSSRTVRRAVDAQREVLLRDLTADR